MPLICVAFGKKLEQSKRQCGKLGGSGDRELKEWRDTQAAENRRIGNERPLPAIGGLGVG